VEGRGSGAAVFVLCGAVCACKKSEHSSIPSELIHPATPYAPDPARQLIHGFILSEFVVSRALLDASRQIQFAMNLLF
jgi:hypothetical protein